MTTIGVRRPHEDRLDTEHEEFPTCPHCGHKEQDYVEIEGVCEEYACVTTDCNSCGEPYRIETTISVVFSSYRPCESWCDFLHPDEKYRREEAAE